MFDEPRAPIASSSTPGRLRCGARGRTHCAGKELEFTQVGLRQEGERAHTGVRQLCGQALQLAARVCERAAFGRRLARHNGETERLNSNIDAAALAQSSAQTAFGGPKAFGNARMIALVKASGAQQHLERSKEIAS